MALEGCVQAIRWIVAVVGAVSVIAFGPAGRAQSESPVVFLSTQLAPVMEAERIRSHVLAGFSGDVDFRPFDSVAAVRALSGEGARTGVVGGIHGDLMVLHGEGLLAGLQSLVVSLGDRRFMGNLMSLTASGDNQPRYIPWAEAVHLMVAHRNALTYLPDGSSLETLTYTDLVAWGEAMAEATGRPMIGFPAGPGGLMHLFLQGHAYPSYTGTMVRGFRSAQAEAMWDMMRRLWAVTTPRSLTFTGMYAPLLSGEVWVAWDNIVRLLPALRERPEDFVVFPVPSGPAGRGYLVVPLGLGMPMDAPDPEAAAALIEYLTRPETQVSLFENVGFFPAVELPDDLDLPPVLVALGRAVSGQTQSPDAVLSVSPPNMMGNRRAFDALYLAAFSRIVLRDHNVRRELDIRAAQLRDVINLAEVPCWRPDAPSIGPCPVE